MDHRRIGRGERAKGQAIRDEHRLLIVRRAGGCGSMRRVADRLHAGLGRLRQLHSWIMRTTAVVVAGGLESWKPRPTPSANSITYPSEPGRRSGTVIDRKPTLLAVTSTRPVNSKESARANERVNRPSRSVVAPIRLLSIPTSASSSGAPVASSTTRPVIVLQAAVCRVTQWSEELSASMTRTPGGNRLHAHEDAIATHRQTDASPS